MIIILSLYGMPKGENYPDLAIGSYRPNLFKWWSNGERTPYSNTMVK